MTTSNQADVDALRHLLDISANFDSNDQIARFILTSNWLRDRAIGVPQPSTNTYRYGSREWRDIVNLADRARMQERDIVFTPARPTAMFLGEQRDEREA